MAITTVLHFRKLLDRPPAVTPAAAVDVRSIVVPDDVAAWLALRQRAVADLVPAPRPWLVDDFQAEMVEKPWWRPEHTWLAAVGDLQTIVGSVTLAERMSTPVVHWLLVDPAWQRRGIGQLLMAHLERAAWDAGRREVGLETHAGWSAAVAFYHSIGYEPVREPSPR
jgi:GNAT superfamily N-acetyltransferase